MTAIMWYLRGRFSWADVRAGWRDELIVRRGIDRGTISGEHRGWWWGAGVGALDYRLGWCASVLIR